jgi:hypothetical protein
MGKRHLMIIAGAGASFDSDYERETASFAGGIETKADDFLSLRIPLANDLFGSRFQTLRAKYPQVQSLASELNARPQGTSVEDFLGDYQKRAQKDPFVLSQLMAAKFYIRDVIATQEQQWYLGNSHNTNWLALLSRLRSHVSMVEDITIATTNYDRLIEYSLSKFPECQYLDIHDYTREDRTNVLKLHGSVDWYKIDSIYQTGRDVKTTPEWTIENAAQIQEGDEFFKTDTMTKRHSIEGKRLIPAIAIPVKTKVDFMCPKTALLRFANRLESTTHLLVIGWRGEDRHIADLIPKHCKYLDHVTLVGRDEDSLHSLAKNLGLDSTFRDGINMATRGFSSFVKGSDALKRLCNHLN